MLGLGLRVKVRQSSGVMYLYLSSALLVGLESVTI